MNEAEEHHGLSRTGDASSGLTRTSRAEHDSFTYDVSVSHAEQNRAWVHGWLIEPLRRAGLRCHSQEWRRRLSRRLRDRHSQNAHGVTREQMVVRHQCVIIPPVTLMA